MQQEKSDKVLLRESYAIFKKYLHPHRRVIFVLIVLSIISAAADAFVPYLAGRVFDAIIALKGDVGAVFRSVFATILVWFALRLVTDVADWQIRLREESLSTRVHSEYMAQGFGQLLLLPVAFHKSRKQGSLGESLSRAASHLSDIVGNVVVNLAPRFLSIIVALMIVFFIQSTLAAVLLGAVLIYLIILVRSVPQLVVKQRKMQAAYSRAYGNAYDALGNII